MPAKSAFLANGLLELIFNATTLNGLAENDSSSPLTDLYVSLHTASPGVSGNQATNETTYTGYVRAVVPRDGTGWVVTGDAVNPADPIDFPECTAAPGQPVTHFAIGTLASGAGTLLYIGAINPQIAIAVGVLPRLKTTSEVTES